MMKTLRSTKGQGMVEYILILGLIALIAFAAVKLLGQHVNTAFESAATDTASLGS